MKRVALASICVGLFAMSGFAQSINARRENQQDRIAQGIKSGSLNANEAAHLETREARLNREIHYDRAHDDGHLTNAEKRQITRQQNRLSRAIYRDKHN